MAHQAHPDLSERDNKEKDLASTYRTSRTASSLNHQNTQHTYTSNRLVSVNLNDVTEIQVWHNVEEDLHSLPFF